MIAGKRKKVLVVDDSAFMRKLISDMLNKHPSLEVIGTARNGKDAMEKIQLSQPDVVTMDIEMPVMNGLEALQLIMERHPVPIVILSSTTKAHTENAVLAIEYGAVDIIAKPGGSISLNLHEVEEEIISKVVAASRVNVQMLTRKLETKREIPMPVLPERSEPIIRAEVSEELATISKKLSIPRETFVIIGTSTGGPRALQEVITRLPADIPSPILIVQHMPPGFTKSLADRLNGMSEITVKEAEDGELIKDGTAYIAPGGKHLKFERVEGTPNGYAIRLDETEPPRAGHRPAVDVLLETAAQYPEIRYVTAIMTGMGYDGKIGMQRLREECRTFTIAESEKTSVVYGMPKAIVEAGLTDTVEDVQQIADAIMENLK